MSLISLFITAVLAENIVLYRFLGICPFLGVSNKEKNALGMGIAVTFVILISTIITFFINKYILIPTDSTYLQTLAFILVIASFVQLSEIVIKKHFNSLYEVLGIYLPLITTNCAVLGVILLSARNSLSLVESIVYAFGSSIGFTLVIYIFSNIREHINKAPVIKSFKGIPIALIVAAIMALIFGRYGA